MSLMVEKADGTLLETRFIHDLEKMEIEGVRVGEHTFGIDHFCILSKHFLSGGFFGWPNGETPQPVNNILEFLFNTYERSEDGTWVRKDSTTIKMVNDG